MVEEQALQPSEAAFPSGVPDQVEGLLQASRDPVRRERSVKARVATRHVSVF